MAIFSIAYGTHEKMDKIDLRMVPLVELGLSCFFDETERHSAAAGCHVLTVHLH